MNPKPGRPPEHLHCGFSAKLKNSIDPFNIRAVEQTDSQAFDLADRWAREYFTKDLVTANNRILAQALILDTLIDPVFGLLLPLPWTGIIACTTLVKVV